jgi:hypothetical protein
VEAAKATGLIPLSAAWTETADLHLLEDSNPAKIFLTVEEFIEWINTNLD